MITIRVREKVEAQKSYNSDIVSLSLSSGAFDYATFCGSWYYNMFAPRNLNLAFELQKRGIRIPSLEGDNDKNKENVCTEYLRGLSWIYGYYRHADKDIDKTWFYPNNYAPLLIDVHYMLDVLVKSGQSLSFLDFKKGVEREPTIPHQLAAVVPHQGVKYVPVAMRHLWRKESPIADLMPIGIIIDKSEREQDIYQGVDYEGSHTKIIVAKSKDWSSINILPVAYFHRIDNAVRDITGIKGELVSNQRDIVFKNERKFATGSSTVHVGHTTHEPQEYRGRGIGRGRSRGRGRGKYIESRGGRGGDYSTRRGGY